MDHQPRVFVNRENHSQSNNTELSIVYYYLLAGVTLFVSVAIFVPRLSGH